jgi:uncharacterized membrane protein YphA (DoxX/SURF4 family)
MHTLGIFYHQMRLRACRWACLHGTLFLRVSLGMVFLWFGALKFFPNLSPAQDLAIHTIDKLTWGVVPSSMSLFVLALWECAIGMGLLLGVYIRVALCLLFLQMFGTLTSLFFFPQEMFTFVPYAPTLEGQYVIKNLVLIGAGIVIGNTLPSRREVKRNTEPMGTFPPPHSRQAPQWNDGALHIRRKLAARPAQPLREVSVR